MNKIDFLDLFAINQRQHKELVSAFSRVLDSGWYIMGEELEQFEKEFAEYCGVKYCIGVANGLDALILVLRAWKELGYLEDGISTGKYIYCFYSCYNREQTCSCSC